MGLELKDLLWDSFNSEHISKHKVTRVEVEETCANRFSVSETQLGRLLLVGKTNSGRFVSVVLAYKGNGVYYPVTARDSGRPERRKIYEKQKQNSKI